LPKEKAEELISKFKELGCVLTLKWYLIYSFMIIFN
jgi:hypothetical protein